MTEPGTGAGINEEAAGEGRPLRELRKTGRAGGRPPRRPMVDDIQDDARRSISVRINTSDYGRLKAIARRLSVRESDVFRHLVRLGVGRLMRALDSNAPSRERYRLLVSLAGELGEDFGLTVADCAALLSTRASPRLSLDAADVELIGMVAAHPQHACTVLASLTREPVDEANLVAKLGRYLDHKHTLPGG